MSTIRLPTAPSLITSLPASELAFFNKFTEMLLFNQALIAALEQIDIETTNMTQTSNSKAEDEATAKGFFFA
jgi:hypothetical protein